MITLPGEDRASVFVGSADGWVTRLKMTTIASAPPPIFQPLVEVARTTKGNAPYALGHGTWGLDVGEVNNASAGLEVAVASYNRVALFRASDLVLLREAVLPDWEYSSPGRLQVADLWGGSELEIVFRTQHNHLVVMDKNLQILREYGEGGIVDLAIGPVPQRAGAWMHRPIYLLSARGHLARLEINNTGLPIAELAAASTLQFGVMRDLDVVTWQGQTRLAALFVPHPTELPSVRLFSPDDLAQVGGFGNVMQELPPPVEGEPTLATIHPTATGDMVPTLTAVKGPSGPRFVIASAGDLSVWDGVGLLGHKRLGMFRATRGYGCVQAGDIDPSTPGDEVVVSTSAGRVGWFKLSELEGSGLSIPVTPRVYADASGTVYEHRCNLSLAATWAMAAQPASGSTPGLLRVVDPTGALWQVNPVSGQPTFQQDLFVGGSSLVSARAPNGFVAGSGGTDPTWQVTPNGPTAATLHSAPYVPSPAPPTWWTPPSSPLDYRVPLQMVQGHWYCPSGGDVYTDPVSGAVWCAWWQRYVGYPNLILCASYTVPGSGGATVQSLWSSTQTNNGGLPPPRWPLPNFLKPLRTEGAATVLQNLQALRLGKVMPNVAEPQVVACAMGGRVMLLSSTTGSAGRIVAESEDLGLGSPALAVADLNGDGVDEVLVATTYSPIPPGGGTVRSYLHVLKFAAPDRLDRVGNPVAIGDHADFHGYAASGIAVAEVPLPAPQPSIPKGIYVATLNGELTILRPDSSGQGSIDPNPVFRTVVEGSIGGFNAIHVADLDPVNPKPEEYLAGSSGIRRFDFQ